MAGGGGDGDVDHGRFWREPMDTTLAAVSPRRRGRRKLNDLGLHSRAIGCASAILAPRVIRSSTRAPVTCAGGGGGRASCRVLLRARRFGGSTDDGRLLVGGPRVFQPLPSY
jgi:hypothetical protein